MSSALSLHSKPSIETEAKEVRGTSSQEPPLPVKEGNNEDDAGNQMEETVQSTPTENIAITSNDEEASSKSQDVDVEDVHYIVQQNFFGIGQENQPSRPNDDGNYDIFL